MTAHPCGTSAQKFVKPELSAQATHNVFHRNDPSPASPWKRGQRYRLADTHSWLGYSSHGELGSIAALSL